MDRFEKELNYWQKLRKKSKSYSVEFFIIEFAMRDLIFEDKPLRVLTNWIGVNQNTHKSTDEDNYERLMFDYNHLMNLNIAYLLFVNLTLREDDHAIDFDNVRGLGFEPVRNREHALNDCETRNDKLMADRHEE